MGCTLSGIEDANREKRELETYVTPEDIRLVTESWKIVGQDLDGAGMMVFHKLFEKNKDLKRLFQNMTHTEADGELVLDEERLRAHSRIVMDGLGAAVESLEDSVILTNILIVMGERHAGYHVRPEMVSLLWPAIRDTFKEKLEDDFTPDIARAWTHVFDYLKARFQEGIRRGRNQKNEILEPRKKTFIYKSTSARTESLSSREMERYDVIPVSGQDNGDKDVSMDSKQKHVEFNGAFDVVHINAHDKELTFVKHVVNELLVTPVHAP